VPSPSPLYNPSSNNRWWVQSETSSSYNNLCSFINLYLGLTCNMQSQRSLLAKGVWIKMNQPGPQGVINRSVYLKEVQVGKVTQSNLDLWILTLHRRRYHRRRRRRHQLWVEHLSIFHSFMTSAALLWLKDNTFPPMFSTSCKKHNLDKS